MSLRVADHVPFVTWVELLGSAVAQEATHVNRSWIPGAALLALAVVGAALCMRSPEPPESPFAEAPPLLSPDAAGTAPLFPEGMEHPTAEITLDQYFADFGGVEAVEPEKQQAREELVGKRVTWEGYVQRVKDARSGNALLTMSLEPQLAQLHAALIRFPPEWREQLHAFEKGDHVRVVAVYDGVVSVFPTLRGISVEAVEEEG